MLEVIQNYPRPELLSTDTQSLYETTTGVLALADRRRLRLFMRRDPYGRFSSCLVYLPRDRYTPTDATQIPTGAIAPVSGTPMDFRRLTPIGARLRDPFPQLVLAHGYDHNWVLNKPQPSALAPAARAYDPRTGRILEVDTSEPGVQVYTSNYLDGAIVGSADKAYRQTAGFTMETQHFPDSPNHPGFPSTELKPGQTFRSTTIFRFLTDR